MEVLFTLNGKRVRVDLPGYTKLSDVLRDHFGLTGLKNGCGRGFCGLCTAAVDGRLIYTCMYPLFQVRGKEVLTIEGYAQTEDFDDVYQGFFREKVHLCGYCVATRTLVTGLLLDRSPNLTEQNIQEIITTVNCTCTPYQSFRKGILRAAWHRRRRKI